jgi:PAS domain S-box-containing protein
VTKFLLAAAAPVKNSQGTIIGAVGGWRDITGLKRAEEALRESEERFRAAFRASPDALVISEVTSGRIIDVNETWINHWGFSREQSVGRQSLELGIFTNPDDRRRVVEIMRNEGHLVNFNIELHTKAGELRHALLSAEKLKLRDRQLMLTIIRDETERKKAEIALQIERGRLQATLKSIPDEVWITDAQGNIIYMNSSLIFDSVGKSDWPDIASALRDLELLNPDGTRRAPEDAALPRALRGEITQKVMEMIRHLKTGELRWA